MAFPSVNMFQEDKYAVRNILTFLKLTIAPKRVLRSAVNKILLEQKKVAFLDAF